MLGSGFEHQMWKHSGEVWKNQTWEAVAGSQPASSGNRAAVEKAELGEERSEPADVA